MEQILDGGSGRGHESRFRCGPPPMTPGQCAKSRRAGAFGVARLRLENFSGGRLPAARFAHQTPAIATPNQIMGWVILSCDWDWVVMDLPFPPGRGPQGWDLPVLGDPPRC